MSTSQALGLDGTSSSNSSSIRGSRLSIHADLGWCVKLCTLCYIQLIRTLEEGKRNHSFKVMRGCLAAAAAATSCHTISNKISSFLSQTKQHAE